MINNAFRLLVMTFLKGKKQDYDTQELCLFGRPIYAESEQVRGSGKI